MVKCPNCRCEIEDSKKILHERFCFQNIIYCELCQEAVIKDEYDEHCLENNNPKKEENDLDLPDEKSRRSLKRVMSSKVACDFCGLFLGYNELEEHEEMCGARTTECKICHKTMILKNLQNHLLTIHNLDKSIYNEMDSGNIYPDYKNKNESQQSLDLKKDLSENTLNRMTSDEQIAYALALSEQNDNSNKINNNDNNNKSKGNLGKINKKSKEVSKKSSSIDYDEIENEYERQMYEEEMKNYGLDKDKK